GAAARPPVVRASAESALPAPEQVVVEAEAAANMLGGGAQRMRRPGIFNGGGVTGLGRSAPGQPEGWLTFTGIPAARPGQYAVTVYYLTPDGLAGYDVWASVRVDGRRAIPLGVFPPARQVRSKIVWVTLRQGYNTLRFGNPYGPAPVIDRILVRPNG
ncbi:hypothetical protein, partial [Luedemannella flava]|uniref:hypothetical protein n=1 Tax=Luedemannella flava TaxID=349316 RepID=UPI0031DA01DB